MSFKFQYPPFKNRRFNYLSLILLTRHLLDILPFKTFPSSYFGQVEKGGNNLQNNLFKNKNKFLLKINSKQKKLHFL